MERELEKDLKEIEYLIYVHKERENTHTRSVLERAHEIIETCAKAARTLSELEELLSRENGPEITRSSRDNEVTECCPHCDREITVSWNVERDGLEKILEEIGELRGQAGSECTSEDHYIKKAWEHCLDRVVGIIRKYMNDGWIPVVERLPEESGYYRVTVKDKELGDITEETAWFAYVDDYDMDESEWRELYEYEEVIAWRELAPYNPERSNDEKE